LLIDIGKMTKYNTVLGEDLFLDEFKGMCILHIPHSKTNIPIMDGYDKTLIDNETKLLVDHATDNIFDIEGIDSIIFEYNRIFCDVERLNDEDEPLYEKGRGFYYTKTDSGKILRELLPDLKLKIKEEYYDKHHSKLEMMTDEKLIKYNNVLIIDCHSFTETPFETDSDKTLDRPDICLGVDDYHTPKWLVNRLETIFKKHNLSVKINSPYSGTIIPLKHYRKDDRVMGIMIEINRKLYMDGDEVIYKSVMSLNKIISETLFV